MTSDNGRWPDGASPVASPPPPSPWTAYGPGMPPYAAEPTTNVLAIVALVSSFFAGIAGIICGHIALGQIRRTGEKGRGLALAGTIIGYVQTGLVVFWIIAVMAVVVIGGVGATVTSSREVPAGASSAADCTTVENAALALSTSLTEVAASSWTEDPAAAKRAVIDATTTFENSVDSLSTSDFSDSLFAEENDLAALGTALVDYQAADDAQKDATSVTDAISTASRGLRELTASCQ